MIPRAALSTPGYSSYRLYFLRLVTSVPAPLLLSQPARQVLRRPLAQHAINRCFSTPRPTERGPLPQDELDELDEVDEQDSPEAAADEWAAEELNENSSWYLDIEP